MNEIGQTASVTWQLWLQDNFDRETPRRVVSSGQGLLAGLTELWACHFSETVQPGGQAGFLRFNLWYAEGDISVVGEQAGQAKIKAWIDEAGQAGLLPVLAEVHLQLLTRGGTSVPIVSLAQEVPNQQAFVDRVSGLVYDD